VLHKVNRLTVPLVVVHQGSLWDVHNASVKQKMRTKGLFENISGTEHMRVIDTGWRIILKWMLDI
jgi:hypothetical protein